MNFRDKKSLCQSMNSKIQSRLMPYGRRLNFGASNYSKRSVMASTQSELKLSSHPPSCPPGSPNSLPIRSHHLHLPYCARSLPLLSPSLPLVDSDYLTFVLTYLYPFLAMRLPLPRIHLAPNLPSCMPCAFLVHHLPFPYPFGMGTASQCA